MNSEVTQDNVFQFVSNAQFYHQHTFKYHYHWQLTQTQIMDSTTTFYHFVVRWCMWWRKTLIRFKRKLNSNKYCYICRWICWTRLICTIHVRWVCLGFYLICCKTMRRGVFTFLCCFFCWYFFFNELNYPSPPESDAMAPNIDWILIRYYSLQVF